MKRFIIGLLAIMIINVCPVTFSNAICGSSVPEKPHLKRIKCQPAAEISINDTLVIEFTQYPGRAYSWELVTSEKELEMLRLVKVRHNDLGQNMPDSQEKVEFYFDGIKEGEQKLVFKYFRPWERSKPAADSCVIKVMVK